MKALLCGKCFDVRALDPHGGWTSCHCGNMSARWLDPQAGTVKVKARIRSVARIIGMNNSFLRKAIYGFDHQEMVEAGGQWEAWRKLHEECTHAPGYIFDESKRACWACIVQVNETRDISWEDEAAPDQEPLVPIEGMDPNQTWNSLGTGYPGVDPCTMAAFDILAPVSAGSSIRVPSYHLTNGLEPTPDQAWALADSLVQAVGKAEP